jgi:hypothetical protein
MNNILAPEPGYSDSATVPTITLDEYARSREVSRVDVIKMDIEGAELRALQGASQLLSGNDAPLIIVEVNPRALAAGNATAADVVNLLEGHGYQVGTIAVYGANTRNPWVNAIAFRPAHRERWPFLGEYCFPPLTVK